MKFNISKQNLSEKQFKYTKNFFLFINHIFKLHILLYLANKCRYYHSIIKACAYFPKNKTLFLNYDVDIKYPNNIKIGKNVRIGPGSTLGALAPITIGDDVVISKNVLIETAGLNYNEFPYHHSASPITIGNRVWIGAGAIILGGVTIGNDSVIGAGAIITKNIPNNVIAINEAKLKLISKTNAQDQLKNK